MTLGASFLSWADLVASWNHVAEVADVAQNGIGVSRIEAKYLLVSGKTQQWHKTITTKRPPSHAADGESIAVKFPFSRT